MFSVHGKYTRENVIDYFSDPDVITKELVLEERIDAKIDKDIVALGRIKTMKSMGLGRRHVVVDHPSPKRQSCRKLAIKLKVVILQNGIEVCGRNWVGLPILTVRQVEAGASERRRATPGGDILVGILLRAVSHFC